MKVLFADETTKRYRHHLQYCGVWVYLFSLVSRIMEEFVELPSAFPLLLKVYSWLLFGFNHSDGI